MSVEAVTTRQGKLFQLLNLPYFAISQVEKYIEWVTNQKNSSLQALLCAHALECGFVLGVALRQQYFNNNAKSMNQKFMLFL